MHFLLTGLKQRFISNTAFVVMWYSHYRFNAHSSALFEIYVRLKIKNKNCNCSHDGVTKCVVIMYQFLKYTAKAVFKKVTVYNRHPKSYWTVILKTYFLSVKIVFCFSDSVNNFKNVWKSFVWKNGDHCFLRFFWLKQFCSVVLVCCKKVNMK